MHIEILHLIEGAKKARGVAVVIDVFRAFTTACHVIANGATQILPVGEISKAYALKEQNPHYILMGERGGMMQPGFDFGNSPTLIEHVSFENKTVVLTTSAGTQGLVNAQYADVILTGSFANAKAIVRHILALNPSHVSIVSMGESGLERTEEDDLCALYLKSLLEGKNPDFSSIKIQLHKANSAQKFFDPACHWAPERDFELCLTPNQFDFVLEAKRRGQKEMVLEKAHRLDFCSATT